METAKHHISAISSLESFQAVLQSAPAIEFGHLIL
jgi:hypothetical protein